MNGNLERTIGLKEFPDGVSFVAVLGCSGYVPKNLDLNPPEYKTNIKYVVILVLVPWCIYLFLNLFKTHPYSSRSWDQMMVLEFKLKTVGIKFQLTNHTSLHRVQSFLTLTVMRAETWGSKPHLVTMVQYWNRPWFPKINLRVGNVFVVCFVVCLFVCLSVWLFRP